MSIIGSRLDELALRGSVFSGHFNSGVRQLSNSFILVGLIVTVVIAVDIVVVGVCSAVLGVVAVVVEVVVVGHQGVTKYQRKFLDMATEH